MANKFTKGILERQEREYKQQHNASQEQAVPEPVPITTPPVTETPPAPPLEKAPEKTLETAIPATLPTDLETYIIRDSGRKAKNKTFYLDGAVIQAIKRAATAQRVAESKLVNDILKKVLLP